VTTPLNRRQMLIASTTAGVALSTSLSASKTANSGEKKMTAMKETEQGIRFCINTSTIREQALPLDEEVTLAAAVGYDSIEPWIREIEAYRDAGKSLPDLKKKIADLGLKVESAIGFAQWIVDDEEKRKAGFEQMKRDMDLLAQIGGTRIAAPPVGAQTPDAPKIDLFAAAERYAEIIRIGRDIGVVPQVELWGFSKNLSRLGESVFVAIESGEKEACLLPDIYHIYKGGSSFEGLHMLSGVGIECFHFNDFPDIPRNTITDADRVYPGNGIAPWPRIREILNSIGFNGVISLELFNRTYWKQDPKQVLTTGLHKMKAAWLGT